jgi:hypothetical protein
MADNAVEVGTPDFWLGRLIRKLGERSKRYKILDNYASGNHPLPEGDIRYVQALKQMQRKARTNYISLVIRAVTQRMRVRAFKFNGDVDQDAKRVWTANNMELQSSIAIADAAKFSDVYALVSLPDDDDDSVPIITIEDPRNCVIERDPVRPLRSIAGLKLYRDDILQKMVAVVYLPERSFVYYGDYPGDSFDFDAISKRIALHGSAAAGFELVEVHENETGDVPLICGVWQPENGFAEAEDGGLDVQDRINATILSRLIITKSQAYRQRLITGVEIAKNPDGSPKKPPFDPGADMVWMVEDENARVWDLQQADIKQILEAVRDDIGDLAAITQTPINFLTNKISNVSGDTLRMAQHSHVAKVRQRMDAMGWFFESVMRLCLKMMGNPKASEIDAEVQWFDPEVHTLAEYADLAAKFAQAGIPMRLVMERLGFTADEIESAEVEIERIRQEDMAQEIEVKKAAPPFQQGFGNSPS